MSWKVFWITIIIMFLMIAGVLFYFNKNNNEVILLEEPSNFSFSIIDTSQQNCSSMSFSGVYFNMPELKDMTNGERAGFTYGYFMGLTSSYINESEPVLIISFECENKTFEKVYNNFSDFTGEDECLKDNLCFIKYSFVAKGEQE